MADDGDKITYELELKGASQMASQLDSIDNRVNRLNKSIIGLGTSFGPSTKTEKSYWELPGLSKYRSKLYDIYSWKKVKNPNKWAANLTPPIPAAKTHGGFMWVRELKRAMRGGSQETNNRAKGYYGIVPFGGTSISRQGTRESWNEIRKRWNSVLLNTVSDSNSQNTAVEAEYEEVKGNDNSKGGNSWWKGLELSKFVPKGSKELLGRLGSVGSVLGGFVGSVSIAGLAFRQLGKAVNTLLGPIKEGAKEVFDFYKTRNMIGEARGGLLSDFSLAGIATGGSAEEFRQLLVRIAGERADLLWGGSGGSMMRAASRFGVDIRGSGERGMATEREWLRNISMRMQQLPESGKLALANAAGLNREQMWMVSHGPEYYDYVTSRKTLAQRVYGGIDAMGEDVYTQNFQEESQNFWTDWAVFVQSFKELIGSIGEILIPLVNIILEILTGIFNVISMLLKPIATILGKILSLLNFSFWANQNMMNDDSSYDRMRSDYGLLNPANHPIITANVTVGDMNVSSNASDSREVASLAVNQLKETLAESLYSSFGSLTGAA